MPVDGSVGYSDDTPIKQEHFGKIIRTHVRITRSFIERPRGPTHPRYLYFDLNAGSGKAGGHVGSPLIFLRAVTNERVPFEAWFFDRVAQSLAELQARVEAYAEEVGGLDGVCHYVLGDHNETLAEVIRQPLGLKATAFGIVYSDSNGAGMPVPGMAALAATRYLRKIDFLAHLNCTSYKRIRERFPQYSELYLSVLLRQIGKKYMWLREPVGIWQFSFAIMSDWDGFPEFKGLGFHRADSPAGIEIERRLNLTAAQYELARRRPLPLEIEPTAAMRSTSAIRSSASSVLSRSRGRKVAANGAAQLRQLSLITFDTRPGEPSMSRRTSSRSATAATPTSTVSRTEAEAEACWADDAANKARAWDAFYKVAPCHDCGGPLLCAECCESIDTCASRPESEQGCHCGGFRPVSCESCRDRFAWVYEEHE